MVILKLFASVLQVVVSGGLWFLDACETRLNKIEIDANGQAHGANLATDPEFLANQPKRKKLKELSEDQELILEPIANEQTSWLSISGIIKTVAFFPLRVIQFWAKIFAVFRPKLLLTNVTTKVKAQKKILWSYIDWILQTLALYILKAIRVGRNILKIINSKLSSYILEGAQMDSSEISNGSDAGRKMISPRKRLPQSKIQMARRCIAKLFYPQTEGFDFDPIEGFEETHSHSKSQNKVSFDDKAMTDQNNDSLTEDMSKISESDEGTPLKMNMTDSFSSDDSPNQTNLNDSQSIIDDLSLNEGNPESKRSSNDDEDDNQIHNGSDLRTDEVNETTISSDDSYLEDDSPNGKMSKKEYSVSSEEDID